MGKLRKNAENAKAKRQKDGGKKMSCPDRAKNQQELTEGTEEQVMRHVRTLRLRLVAAALAGLTLQGAE
jgi:Skp family chaperone for outer membrane proteins